MFSSVTVAMKTESVIDIETADIRKDSTGRKNLFDVLFGPVTRAFAVFAIPVSFFLPVDGMGIGICWIKRMLDLPCPGCGLTRSITSVSHLQFFKAWEYHPFGILIYLLLAMNLGLLIMPRSSHMAMRNFFGTNARVSHLVYCVAIGYFLVFGFCRMAIHYWF